MPNRRDFLKTTAAMAVSPYLRSSVASQPSGVVSEVFADFEAGSYEGWTLEGNCWGTGPASDETFAGRIRGFQGKRFLCTLHPTLGVNAVGKAISREFRIEKPFIDFLVGGGKHPGEACLNLVVEGQVVRTATGDDTPELNPVCWDVSLLIGKTAHFEVIDSTRSALRGYVMVDTIRLAAAPPFRELVAGQSAFFCFSKEDVAGREFQRVFSTPEGRTNRALIDWCVDRVTEQLGIDLRFVNRSELGQCETLLRSALDRIFQRYQVRDALAKQLIAANACSALAALLTEYDDDLAAFILRKGEKDAAAYDYIIKMRDPSVVLRRGKAVCTGIAAFEQRLAVSLQDLGLECLVANGQTRLADYSPYATLNHSWTVYSLAQKSLWVPSDTTHALSVLRSAKKLPKAKLVRSTMLLVDPMLRDMYTLFHFMRECRIGYPGKYVNERVINLTTQKEWMAFHETHPYILKSARTALAQLDKEDVARLA